MFTTILQLKKFNQISGFFKTTKSITSPKIQISKILIQLNFYILQFNHLIDFKFTKHILDKYIDKFSKKLLIYFLKYIQNLQIHKPLFNLQNLKSLNTNLTLKSSQ